MINSNDFNKLKDKIKKLEKKSKGKKSKKILYKPKEINIKEYDAVKSALKNAGNTKFVKEGEVGYFKENYDKERKSFLGRYSL